jgi:hypothetical protein
MTDALEPLRHSKTILLTTYKRDGTPVATPVSIAFEAIAHSFGPITRHGRRSDSATTRSSRLRPAHSAASRLAQQSAPEPLF